MFDFEIKAVAQSIDPSELPARNRDVPDDEILLQVWAGDSLIYSSDPSVKVPRATSVGYSAVSDANGAYRTYVRPAGAARVQVTQSVASRRTLAVEYSLRLLAPLLVVIPLMCAAIWWLTRRSLVPVGRLGDALSARTDGVLDAIDTGSLPAELLPLVTGFNRLLQRLKGAFEAQRTLVADAAHELRTPLAVVQIQAQTLERMGASQPQQAALRALLDGVSRATRVVEQLLTLARHDAPGAAPATEQVQLTDLVRSTVADLLPLAEHKHIEVSFEADSQVALAGDRGALQALVANLVDNSIKYTSSGGRISVGLTTRNGVITLTVADTGPGIPISERTLVLDRFYRIPGSAAAGSGLGLAIAAAVIQRHRGRLELDDAPGGGLLVEVTLPRTRFEKCAHGDRPG